MIPSFRKEKIQLKVRVEKNVRDAAWAVAQAEQIPIQEIVEAAILAYCLPRLRDAKKILEIREQASKES